MKINWNLVISLIIGTILVTALILTVYVSYEFGGDMKNYCDENGGKLLYTDLQYSCLKKEGDHYIKYYIQKIDNGDYVLIK